MRASVRVRASVSVRASVRVTLTVRASMGSELKGRQHSAASWAATPGTPTRRHLGEV